MSNELPTTKQSGLIRLENQLSPVAYPTKKIDLNSSTAIVIEDDHAVADHLVLSVISVFFCGWIGVFSLLKTFESRDSKKRGNFRIAKKQASSAKKIAIAAIFSSPLFVALIIASILLIANEYK